MIGEIEEALRVATCMALGLNPKKDSKDAGTVRIGWLSEGAPFPGPKKDVAYLFVEVADEPISQQRDVSQTGIIGTMTKIQTEYIVVVKARWVLYGPHCDANAFRIRDGLFRTDIHTVNSKANLFLITNPSMPRRFPEHFNGNWRERWDFEARFNHKYTHETEWPYLEPGQVIIKEG